VLLSYWPVSERLSRIPSTIGRPASHSSVTVPSENKAGVLSAEWPARSASAYALAWSDIAEGFSRSWMWTALALQDIKLRYRGSVLGPFWVTINTLMMVAGMSLIYSQLFNIDKNTYLPYLTIGLVVWQFISGVITDSCDTFVRAEGTIKQTPVPFSVYAYRGTCRNLLILAHSLPVVPLAWAVFGVHVDWYVIEIVPALVILAINGCWLGILLA
jgi:homopolymeric O-antigen transport system permease protein